MIAGTGIDMLEISRCRFLLQKHRDLSRIFGSDELRSINHAKDAARVFASCFCAKEAFSKALGTGIRGFGLNDVQLLHDELGKPFLLLSGQALAISESLGLTFHVSITHTGSTAAAFVVAEKKPD